MSLNEIDMLMMMMEVAIKFSAREDGKNLHTPRAVKSISIPNTFITIKWDVERKFHVRPLRVTYRWMIGRKQYYDHIIQSDDIHDTSQVHQA